MKLAAAEKAKFTARRNQTKVGLKYVEYTGVKYGLL